VTATLMASCPPQTLNVRCNSLTFPVLKWGPDGGRPVLLLHGFPQEPATWTAVAEALLPDGFQLFAPFQRGYAPGTRAAGSGDCSFDQFVDDAVALIEALHLTKPDVVGFGMGGAQAWMLAASCPERVRSLTSLRFPHPAAFARGVRFEPEQREKWRRLQEQLGSGSLEDRAAVMLDAEAAGLRRLLSTNGLPPAFVDRYVARLREPGALTGALAWEHAISLEDFASVPDILVPTLLLWSEGPALSKATVVATQEHVRASFTEVLVPACGNFMLEVAPLRVAPPLREHLLRH